MTPKELHDELERRLNAATPLPWLISPQGYPGIVAAKRGRQETAPVFKEEGYHGDDRAANIALTVAVMNNLPTLLRALSALSGLEGLAQYIEDYAVLSGRQMHDKYGDDAMLGFDNVVRRARSALSQLDQLEAADK